jgi:hypothetical protein
MQTQRKCPDCGGNDLRRSRRRGAAERLLILAGGHVYRCRSCQCRFSALALSATGWKSGHGSGSREAWRRGAVLTISALIFAVVFLIYIAHRPD